MNQSTVKYESNKVRVKYESKYSKVCTSQNTYPFIIAHEYKNKKISSKKHERETVWHFLLSLDILDAP